MAEIAQLVEGEVVGDKGLVVTGLSGIKEARPGDLTFIANPKYTSLAKTTQASAILTPRHVHILNKSIVRTDSPSLAFARIASLMHDGQRYRPQGIHKTATIAKDAVIGRHVAIGPYVVVESAAKIGQHAVIGSGSYIGHHSVIGENTLIYPHVTIRDGVTIGDRVIIHSGTVIGSDGFGFVWANGRHEKIPQIGGVLIGNDVEIGANVTIDRARFDKTVIGDGTKIDNLVQIAHNVTIGRHCIIISQVGISGSTIIGDGAILAGQAGTDGHLTIGEGAVVASRAGVTKSVAPHTKVSGFPAQPHRAEQRLQASLRRIPSYIKVMRDLRNRVEQLEKKLKNG